MLKMGLRCRRKLVIIGGSILFTICSFQLTGFIALGGDEDSQRFSNNALPTGRGNLRTFTPVKGHKGRGKPLGGAGGRFEEEMRLDSKDTRRTLQDIRTADDIKGHPRLGGGSVSVISRPPIGGTDSVKNATVATTTRLNFESLFPSLLEEERCPLCFGSSSCDQIYSGNISFHVGATNLSEPHAIPGQWGRRRILGKRLVKRELFEKLERIICEESMTVAPGQTCEVNAAATNSWISRSNALDRVHKLHRNVYQDSPISLSATTCASSDFLDSMKQLYGVSRWKDGIQSTEMAILTATLALDPEPALLKFFRNIPPLQPYFPEYLGECGRVIMTEPTGTPLVNVLKASWQERVEVSLKILQMIEDFHEASDKWLIFFLDFAYDNFVLTADGQLRLVNLGSVVVVDKEQTSKVPKALPQLNNYTELCNEDCLNGFIKKLGTEPEAQCRLVPQHVEFMYMMACHSLLSDLITTKYERFFQPLDLPRRNHPGGLLHDAPYEVDAKLSELLYECVFEGQPGKRMHSVRNLKHLLHIIKRYFPYVKTS